MNVCSYVRGLLNAWQRVIESSPVAPLPAAGETAGPALLLVSGGAGHPTHRGPLFSCPVCGEQLLCKLGAEEWEFGRPMSPDEYRWETEQ